MRKLFFWMPLVLVGSLVYWSLAVSLGGMSLWAIWPSSDAVEKDIYQPITVKLVGDVEASDLAPCELVETADRAIEGATPGPAESTPPTLGPTQGPGDTAF
jgi:hypothetical protein